MIKFDESGLDKTLPSGAIDKFIADNKKIITEVLAGQYGMADALGWFKVAENTGAPLMEKIRVKAAEIKRDADVFILAGVGGSNRAAQSVIEGMEYHRKGKPKILYMGNTLSANEINNCLESFEGKSVYANIIAKNFATLEPALAFRVIRSWMNKKYGPSYSSRITVTGSYGKGQLADIAQSNGYSFFEFPAAVGGRFSAFTAVGLLPMAVMGADIEGFVRGGLNSELRLKSGAKSDAGGHESVRYAAARHLLRQKGFTAEAFSYFEPSLQMLARWWLQLHGETEGKNTQAVLPTMSCFSEDLHAIGQYYQEGGRFFFETFLDFFKPKKINLPASAWDDGLSYLEGKSLDCLNPAVSKATSDAHYGAGVPVLKFSADKVDEETIGEFMYMQMLSTYFSAAFLGVEPFDQNGVESYKRNLARELTFAT
ncbi:MAG: hypothetical protein FWD78_03335 [Treponema sp.]|nr:hypothetical protein [Treponema sp.]